MLSKQQNLELSVHSTDNFNIKSDKSYSGSSPKGKTRFFIKSNQNSSLNKNYRLDHEVTSLSNTSEISYFWICG